MMHPLKSAGEVQIHNTSKRINLLSSPAADLAALIPSLLAPAAAWAKAQEAAILVSGRPLDEIEATLAVMVGVQHPDRVRIKLVKGMPQPDTAELRGIATETKLIGPRTSGITFGHGIYIRVGCITNRLVSHELRHVHQYEQFGSIGAFLATYLDQIATVGYERAALELDARRHERNAP
jgi:hypothetical protein